MSSHVGGIGPQGLANPVAGRTTYRFIDDAQRMPTDSVQLSDEFMRLRGIDGGIRLDRVMEVRQLIGEGKVYTADALERSLDMALDEVFGKAQ